MPGFYIAGYEQPSRSIPATQPIIPANRLTTFQPGVTYNAIPSITSSPGIPHRTTIFTTLSPIGGGSDDGPQINSAMASCPAGQVVLLTTGVFTIKTNLNYRPGSGTGQLQGITIRGAGPGRGLGTGQQGSFVTDATATQLLFSADPGPCWNVNGYTATTSSGSFVSYNLAADAIQGQFSCTLTSDAGLTTGQIIRIDQYCSGTTYPTGSNDPDIWWGNNHTGLGTSTRAFFCRQDRPLSQLMEVASYNSSTFTVTFTTPFHHNYCAGSGTSASGVVGGLAQIGVPNQTLLIAMGIEDMMLFDASSTGRGNGTIAMGSCAYSWVKHVEVQWCEGGGVILGGCFRCEVRDSYIHESSNSTPGGAGYLLMMNWATSDSLLENNISWFGDKVNVCQATGGGNVIAYNYMDDAMILTAPSLPEAGVNAAHMIGSHMELIEGNWSHKYQGDSFWGNVLDITLLRNWFTALRGARPPLNTYTFVSGPTTFPYIDEGTRAACHIQGFCYRTNVVGNVLGFNGQTLLSYNAGGYSFAQTTFTYEDLDTVADGTHLYMYYIGEIQTANTFTWDSVNYQTQLRQGNWDWISNSQQWHGIGGSNEYGGNPGPPFPVIPNSLYLPGGAPPAFWGSNTWPWVDPRTGTTYTLPAKARYDSGNYNTI